MPFLFNQVAIFELKAYTQKNANPKFQRHLPLGIGSIFIPVTILNSSNCHAPVWNPQCTPLTSIFLDYCSLWSAFCVPFDMGQISTWGTESCIMWILFVSQRNLFLFPCTWANTWQSFLRFPDRQGKKHLKPSKAQSIQNNSFNYYYKM